MSQYSEGNSKAFVAGEALNAFCRVKLSAGTVIYSGVAEDWIGTTEIAVANGEQVTVRLRTASGTRKMRVAGAFSAGAQVYGAADGEIDDVVLGQVQGIALEAATAAHDIVEVITGTDLAAVIGTLADAILGVPLLIREQVAGSTVAVFTADCPRKILIIGAWLICSAAHANGTIKLTDGTNDITDAMICAVDKVVVHAGTIDDAYNTIALGGSLSLVPANTGTGEVFILCIPIA
jgi:hypothetical protein